MSRTPEHNDWKSPHIDLSDAERLVFGRVDHVYPAIKIVREDGSEDIYASGRGGNWSVPSRGAQRFEAPEHTGLN